ncbi:DUF6518 family protein [Micromonospora sp. NPDC092111]|uniref:DUF6518 family protein n=1 Tax=Micromonospora sp. NPDC092111 TaxID=3364289 RepID=UPI0037F79295
MTVDRRAVAIGAVLGGFLLGFLDFVWIRFVPYPFAELGNSSAVWAVAAFVFGYQVRSGWVRAALGAVALLVVAVPSYYLVAALIQQDDISVVWAASSLLWMFFGVLAGVVFGVAGVWARAAGWRQTVGVALPGAVLFAEAALLARRIGDPDYGGGRVWSVVIAATLGVLLIVLVARTARRRALALAAALPLALVGFAGFLVAGFG